MNFKHEVEKINSRYLVIYIRGGEGEVAYFKDMTDLKFALMKIENLNEMVDQGDEDEYKTIIHDIIEIKHRYKHEMVKSVGLEVVDRVELPARFNEEDD